MNDEPQRENKGRSRGGRVGCGDGGRCSGEMELGYKPTIFTRARAARKVMALMERECRIGRGRLRCESRLESDLGVVGDDLRDLLGVMRDELGVDMTGFDGEEGISPEGLPLVPMLVMLVAVMGMGMAVDALAPWAPRWVMTGAVMGNVVGLGLLAARAGGRRGSRKGCELTMRDLVLAVEARRWRGWGAGMRREFPVSRGAECWERACEHDGRNTF